MNKDIIYNFIGASLYSLFIGIIIVAGISFILWVNQADEDTIETQQRIMEMNNELVEIQQNVDDIKILINNK